MKRIDSTNLTPKLTMTWIPCPAIFSGDRFFQLSGDMLLQSQATHLGRYPSILGHCT